MRVQVKGARLVVAGTDEVVEGYEVVEPEAQAEPGQTLSPAAAAKEVVRADVPLPPADGDKRAFYRAAREQEARYDRLLQNHQISREADVEGGAEVKGPNPVAASAADPAMADPDAEGGNTQADADKAVEEMAGAEQPQPPPEAPPGDLAERPAPGRKRSSGDR